MADSVDRPASPSKGKGKLKDFSSEFDDLDPVVTYRHIFSPTIGPKHPLRVVALCDCNAFYANCEQVRLGIDPEKPLVVAQWGMLIAVNYPAREFGISRMDKPHEAVKRCKDLIVVHVATYAEGELEPKYHEKPDAKTHKISLDLYRRECIKVVNTYKESLIGGEIEKASIDESFIDFSIPVRDELLRRFPHLKDVPLDAPQGIDTPLPSPPSSVEWPENGNLVPIDPSKFDPSDKTLTTEQVIEAEKDLIPTWHDVCLSIAAELMSRMRKAVFERLGYYTTAGIGRNKFLAKLAASYRKRNTQNILRNSAIPGFLKPMPFQKIRNLGGKLGKALAEEFDAATVGDLLSVDLDEMQRKFGESAIWVYEVLRGIDRSEVKEKPAINKSMLASKNLPNPLSSTAEGPHWIKMLTSELAIRLHEARELTPGLWPKTISLHICEGWSDRKSKQAPFPSPRTVTIDLVLGEAMKLWNEMCKEGWRKGMKITHMGVSFHGITWAEEGQRAIETFLMAAPSRPVLTKDRARSVSVGVRDTSVEPARDVDIDDDSSYSFTCPRCKKEVSVPRKTLAECRNVSGENGDLASELQGNALAALKQEHEDFHFAQDLMRENRPIITNNTASGSGSPKRPVKKQKKGGQASEPAGIAKFFIQKGKT
ncbi:eta DNA polymerase [Schizopora paradoxa]|uniref:DNA polymerase eta n=1 Tax=Schizopora paradoxa TaxID=27342 RepID=A0A0H2RUD2_9AGAM|nr:eta DNA polymerase [Schizopora paradoxa]